MDYLFVEQETRYLETGRKSSVYLQKNFPVNFEEFPKNSISEHLSPITFAQRYLDITLTLVTMNQIYTSLYFFFFLTIATNILFFQAFLNFIYLFF